MPNQPRHKVQKSSPLAEFCERQKLTLGKLEELCAATGTHVSKTTFHRLMKNALSPEYESKLFGILAQVLPDYLFKQGLAKAEIDQMLLGIFERGEYQPMIAQRLELSRAAQKYFGLKADPFSQPPQNRDEVFISPALQEIVDRVIDAIRYQGFISVTGEIGSGKSTLRALVEDQLADNPNMRVVWPEFFDMKNVTPMQIAESILQTFDCSVPQSAVRRGRAVKELLARLYQDGTRVAIAFDECHRLGDPALSSLKNFLEMNSGGFQRYLGVVLFGQPIFEARLREYHFREIVERVVPLKMPNFTDSAAAYLDHRLQLVGGSVERLFDAEALELVCRQATTPLALGNVANEALKISMELFNNKQAIGSAIKTKMFFENSKQSFSLRKAS